MKLGVLISGRGSNLKAIVASIRAGAIPAEIGVVVSNVAEAPGLAWAKSEGIATVCLPHPESPSRAEHDSRVDDVLKAHGVGLVCLAGYMRLLGPDFTSAWSGHLLNVHPSLLPAFPGLDAQHQAWTHGVKVSGATVHFVDEALDHGPIVLQECVAVLDEDTPESLATRILEVEHRIYPQAISLVARGAVVREGRRVRVVGAAS